MRANYHTHTPRCNHAVGAEREYVERAVEGGLEILGFSDHTPYIFEGESYRSRIRMAPEELADYVGTVNALKEEFAGRLEIHVGVEAEYYPRFFPRLVDFLREHPVEYMILGQHCLGNEINEWYSGRPSSDEKILDRYISQSIEAIQTGLFTYFAHPDLVNFTGSEAEYNRQIRRLCRAANDAKLPMEINLLGLRENRHYPADRFWQIAGEEGVTAILGSDAHRPVDVWDPETEKKAVELADRYHLTLLETAVLKKL